MSRKLIYLIIALYFLSWGVFAKIIEVAPADARMGTWILGGGGAPAPGGVCTLGVDGTESGGVPHTLEIEDITQRSFVGQTDWQNGSEVCICKVSVILDHKLGDVTGNTYTVSIYTQTGDNLNAVVTNGTSAGVTGSNDWSADTIDFNFSPCATVSASTNYSIVINHDNDFNASNYVRAYYDDEADSLTGIAARFGIDGTWGADLPGDAMFKIYWEQ